MKGSHMKPYDPSLCLRCEKTEAALGSFYCESCLNQLLHPQAPAKELPVTNNRCRPPRRVGYIPPRG